MIDRFTDHHNEFYTQKMQVILTKRDVINENSYLFRFDFKNQNDKLSLLVTQHILIYGENLKNEIVTRKYTPIVDQQGYFLVPIKIYRPCQQYPEGGELTPWLEKIELNTEITIKRCIGKLLYFNQQFILKPKINKIPSQFKSIFIICGGSGITPAYQLIQNVCNNPQDNTKITLLYANRTQQDIWLYKELEQFISDKFKVYYTLDQIPIDWKGFNGYVNLEMIQKIFAYEIESTLALLCGPKQMNKLVINLYEQIGFKKENILKF